MRNSPAIGTGSGWILAAFAGLVLASCSRSDEAERAEVPPPQARDLPRDSTLAEGSADAIGHSQGGLGFGVAEPPLTWMEDGFKQEYTGVNFNTLKVFDSVKLPSGEWESVTHQSSALFSLMHVSPARLDRYDLLGIARDGDIVVSRWNLVAQAGTVVSSGGGTGVTSGALQPKAFLKQQLFKGLNGHAPRGIEGDPQGRFVLFALRDADSLTTVYRLDTITAGNQPFPLADSATYPALSDLQYTEKFDHSLLGRVYVFETWVTNRQRVIFVDANNDGVFDGPPLAGDDAYFESLGLDAYEDWHPMYR